MAAVADARQRDADRHTLRTVRHEATPDNPATTRVDEHRVGVGMAVPERHLAAAEGAQARSGRVAATAVDVAATAYPEPINSSGATAARQAVGAPVPATQQQAAAGQSASVQPAAASQAAVTPAASLAAPLPAATPVAQPPRRAARR